MALPQMKHLGCAVRMTPTSTHLTCEALGFYEEELPMSFSRLPVFDLWNVVKGRMKVNRDTSLRS
eukprot:11283757-Karenia_brevis.AAC.1